MLLFCFFFLFSNYFIGSISGSHKGHFGEETNDGDPRAL